MLALYNGSGNDYAELVGLGQDLPTLVGLGQDLPFTGLGQETYNNGPTAMEKAAAAAPAVVAEAAPRVQKLLEDLRANMRKVQAAERNATLIGLGAGVVGAGIGTGIGAYVGKAGTDATRRIVTSAGGAVGAFGLGILGFFVGRRFLMPPMPGREVGKAIVAAVGTAAIENLPDAAAAANAKLAEQQAAFYGWR